MFKVDEYLRRARLARETAKASSDGVKVEYQRLAKEWDNLAMERLYFLKDMVHDKAMSWRQCEEGAMIEPRREVREISP